MRGKRNGVLSDAETYEARYGAKRSVADIAESEGVTPGAIQMRLTQERKRRQEAGKVVHRSKRGRQRQPRKMVRGRMVVVPAVDMAEAARVDPASPARGRVAIELGLAEEKGKREYHDKVLRLPPVNEPREHPVAAFIRTLTDLTGALARL